MVMCMRAVWRKPALHERPARLPGFGLAIRAKQTRQSTSDRSSGVAVPALQKRPRPACRGTAKASRSAGRQRQCVLVVAVVDEPLLSEDPATITPITTAVTTPATTCVVVEPAAVLEAAVVEPAAVPV